MNQRSTMHSPISSVQPSGCTSVALPPQHHPVTSPPVVSGSLPHKVSVAANRQQSQPRTVFRSGPNLITGGMNASVNDHSISKQIRYVFSGNGTYLSWIHRKKSLIATMAVMLFMAISLGTVPVFAVTIPATKDLSCLAARINNPNCTANDFEVITSFSAAPNTPPFCIEGESFEFEIDVNLTSKSPDRYDIGFFFGQNKNNPATDTSNNCSVATFPTSFIPSTPPSQTQPWGDFDNKNVCSDFLGGGTVITRVDKIKVMCQGSATGALLVPYTLVYSQNKGSATSCTGPLDVLPGTSSKCQGSTSATVDGVIKVFSGAYVDVTKQTSPDGDAQSFSYTATGPAGSSVIAVTNPTSWSPLTGGTYTPSSYTNATNSVTVSLSDGETARFLISALDTDQTLTIIETANADWDTTAKISCAAVTGTPPLTTNNDTRTITAALSKTNLAAACTVINEKLARVTIVKQSNGGTGSFNFSGGTNGLPANLSLDTTNDNPKNSVTYKVNANYAATAITEAIPASWTLNSTLTTCTDGSTTFGTLSGETLTIPAVNVTPGNNIICTFMNDKNALQSPNLTVLKTAFGVSSGSSAKPGQEIPYAITVTNAGAGNAWNTSVTDALSPYTAFKLNSLTFADGSISSGLSMAGSTTSYSYDNGATWTTTPPADLGGGYNGNVTNWMIVFDPTVQMNSSNAFFTIAYKVVVK